MILSSRNLVISLLASASVAAIVMACGSDESKFGDETVAPGVFGDGGFGEGGDPAGDDLYKNDPPPPWCGPETGVVPPPIGGTEECPDDKNKPGCGCPTLGEEAPCWTGLRRHRNLGICQDGVAKCQPKNENSYVWGECEGQVLPKRDATGAEACSCFSVGEWKIANTSPCLRNTAGSYYAYSTVLDNGQATNCGNDAKPIPPAGQPPSGIWSTSTLKVDCAGEFKLCFRIRAGNYNAPSTNDCILGEVCTDAVYNEPNVEQTLPDLTTWAGKDNACAKKWEADTPENVSPGYGEMIVKGQTVRCDAIDDGAGNDYVFHRVQYCARSCRNPANANNPECVECQLAGKGSF
ncbi:MAG: hypothetical protein KF850_29415 [Labilithrix sp.]|nr:hypothetical protein [Labilithrix sp.]